MMDVGGGSAGREPAGRRSVETQLEDAAHIQRDDPAEESRESP